MVNIEYKYIHLCAHCEHTHSYLSGHTHKHTHTLTYNIACNTAPKAQELQCTGPHLLGHGRRKLLGVLGLLQQGLALRAEAIHLFQGALACPQDEAAELGDLQLDLEDRGAAH